MNAILVQEALKKIPNCNVLVNLVSRRVRQLNAGGGAGRPLIADVGNLGAGDVALREIIEDRMSFEMPDLIPLLRPTGRNRKRPQNWARDAGVTTSNEHLKGKYEKHDIQSKTDERE